MRKAIFLKKIQFKIKKIASKRRQYEKRSFKFAFDIKS